MRIRFASGLTAAFLALLLLGALGPPPERIFDAVEDRPTVDVRLRAIDPGLRQALEPLYGPVHLLSAQSTAGLLAWVLWTMSGLFLARLALRSRSEGFRAALVKEGAALPGLYLALAALPIALTWLELIPKSTRRLLTPVGLPLAVYLPWLLAATVRAARRGEGIRRAAFRVTSSFLGTAGWACLPFLAAAYLFHLLPGAIRAGERLDAPASAVVFDIHAHGRRSRDTLLDDFRRAELFRLHGLRLSALTDHNAFEPAAEPLLLPGQEFTTHALHLLLLGIRRAYKPSDYEIPGTRDRRHLPPDYGYDYRRLIDDVHRDGGFVVVAHWASLRQRTRVPWRRLVELGVDGFEIVSDTDRVPPELVRQWKQAGMKLFSGSDFHGWRTSVYGWNLVAEDVVNPDKKDLRELDPRDLVRRIFAAGEIRVLTTTSLAPPWLAPPLEAWRYARSLSPLGRVSWAALALAIWGVGRLTLSRRPPRRPSGAAPAGG